ncbi:hypothetical protein BBW65_05075 [Helicobacter enhydrae]|uniref:Glycosyltransferase 2-like domain-containing protein n=1 Tax=Helicobacter enhydrae TaxID=222136 RepID=A0A1B1U624_9HELI|nr:glycosyltransferase family A protein [Helicobacter enhydrae]ANV98209.1 hypothetical protein BBW65_05075 [Helicobacter enhydrae]
MKPHIYVVVPFYNVEKYLQDCIQSILHQSYQNTSIILVNDGSTDKSGEIAKKYLNHSHITLICKENGGLSSARNAGIEEVLKNNPKRDDILVFLDSDDMIGEGFLVSMVENATKYPDADILLGGVQFISEEGKPLERYTRQDSSCRAMEYLASIEGNYFAFSWGGGG